MIFVFLLALLIEPTCSDTSNDYELLLVQAIWRHGDRSPTDPFKSDPFQESNWTFGGGGFGQLSPIGMAQHLNLGKRIRKLYVDTGFLRNYYSSREIYIRSSDVNRTIISAMSNMIGMYGQDNNQSFAGRDYPAVDGWPAGLVPIAVHTVDDNTDYIVNPDAKCPRQKQLWSMAKSSDELQNFVKQPYVSELLINLTKYCNETIDIDNLWIVCDSLLIEQIHFNDTLRRSNKWFSDELYKHMVIVNDQVQTYQNGVFGKPISMNGLDIGLELQKIRGGSMVNDINMHMDLKIECLNNSASKCKWINDLKYHVYSGHDTTIYAFFSGLGIENETGKPHGYPSYSAAVFIELWRNKNDKQYYFKMNYHANETTNLIPLTEKLIGCKGQQYCDLNVYRKFAQKLKPDMEMSEWCYKDPRNHSEHSGTNLTFIIAITTTLFVLWKGT